MKIPNKRFATVAAAAVGAAAAALSVNSRLWKRATSQAVARLRSSGSHRRAAQFDPEQLAGLPAPTVRFFEFALSPGQPLIRSARIEHRGEFRGSLDDHWSPFRSVQHFSADPPGFVWDARIRMAPLVNVRVRDSYVGGHAAMLGKIAALIPVADQQGSPELASGALHRYLAEAAWLPTALLPRQGVAWEAIDESTARVILSDSGITVSLDVHFGASGEIVRVEAERFRDENGVGVLRPWVGHFWNYAEVDGMKIPTEGEVAWILPEGRLTYWRGRIDTIEYDFAR